MKNILLINQYAGNKGDRAVLFAFCNLIHKLYPDCNITVSTSHPDLWADVKYYRANNIEFVPSAWNFEYNSKGLYWNTLEKFKKYSFTILREAFLLNIGRLIAPLIMNPLTKQAIKKADFAVSVGGHHFTIILSRDLVSSINYDAMSVLSFRKPFVCFSQSFGPFVFYNPRNKKVTGKILSECKSLYPREDKSGEELKEFGIPENLIHPTFESVLSLNLMFEHRKPIPERSNRIGIAIYCAQARTKDEEKKYIDNMIALCDGLNERGYDVQFFPMELKDSGPDDRKMIKKILTGVKTPKQCSFIDEDLDTLEHLKKVEDCKAFIGHKTHSTIFALLTGTPLIGIAYHPKTIEFMRQFGLEDNGINDSDFTSNRILSVFDRMEPDLDNISALEFNKSTEISKRIQKDFKEAVEL